MTKRGFSVQLWTAPGVTFHSPSASEPRINIRGVLKIKQDPLRQGLTLKRPIGIKRKWYTREMILSVYVQTSPTVNPRTYTQTYTPTEVQERGLFQTYTPTEVQERELFQPCEETWLYHLCLICDQF